MLFDLKGKRRRTVQVTYVGLAFLMAVGLVGAGVGSGVSGGIFDLFGGGGGSSTADKTVEKRIDRAQKALRVNPEDQAAMVLLVRSHYQLASIDTDQRTGQFGKDGKKELRKADAAWERYVNSDPKKVDESLANLMVNAYSPIGLNDSTKAAGVAEILATERDDAQAWFQLFTYATAAGQTRKADLAADKALEKAPKNQKKQIKDAIAQAKQQAQQAQGGAASGAPPGGATPTPAPSGG
jgi:tetratricopeptide (TPR) repeat protein